MDPSEGSKSKPPEHANKILLKIFGSLKVASCTAP